MKLGETGTKYNWYWLQFDEVIRRDKPDVQEKMEWCHTTFGIGNWDVDIVRWYFKTEEARTMFIITWT